ncbi:replication protein A 32 kDa subunit A-like [Bidens hawaiensis]|uniref:replication protein A 32 kDa subunit A-like n=1 Tax=Bidens hawaiensis TaxID=980011 RepID=UPI0040499439
MSLLASTSSPASVSLNTLAGLKLSIKNDQYKKLGKKKICFSSHLIIYKIMILKVKITNLYFLATATATATAIAVGNHHSGDDESNLHVSCDYVNVSIVGMVFNMVEWYADATFTLDYGTGKLDCKGKTWLNEPYYRLQTPKIRRDGIYVHVRGQVRSFKGETHVAVFSVRPVKNFNGITFHFIASIHENMRPAKVQNGDSDNIINSTPNTPSQQSEPSNANQIVLDYLQLPANKSEERGIHLDELLRNINLPIKKIMESVRKLEDEGD